MSVTRPALSKKLNQLFVIPKEEIRPKIFFIYIVVAYIFGVILRLTAFIQASQIKAFWMDGKPVSIWTPDAGRYGYYAKEILHGSELPFSADYLTGHLIAWVCRVFDISVEWAMLLLPVFIAPLIVIPVMMIAKSIKQPTLGFLASMIAVSEFYFYARTFLGYMDTDGMNLFLIVLAIAFIIQTISKNNLLYALCASLTLVLFSQWYHSSSIINLMILGMTLFTVLVYYRTEKISIQTIFLLSLAIIPVSLELKLLSIFALTVILMILNRYSAVNHRFYWLVLVFGMLTAFFIIDHNHYIHRAMKYLAPHEQLTFFGNGITYAYANDLLSVSEVKGSHLWDAGAPAPYGLTTIYVVMGMAGYLVLLLFYPLMWVTLPLFILGMLASIAGSRFSMYATPVIAIGTVYVFYVLKSMFLQKYRQSVYARRFPYYVVMLVLLLMIYNLLVLNMSAMLMSNIYAPEAKELKRFSHKLKDEDMMISWWDYGWPLWYYTQNNNTLVDNGKHGGPDTYIIARMLLSSDQKYTYNAAKILADNRAKATQEGDEFVMQYLAKDHNLSALFSPELSEKTLVKTENIEDIYIILHYKMLDYLDVINAFSKKGFTVSSLGTPPMFKMTELLKPFAENHSLLEGYAYILDSLDGTVTDANKNKTPVHGLTIVQNNTRTKGYFFEHDNNKTNSQVIVYKNKFIWLDQKLYDSFYIQAMLFDVYDKKLFEKVGETPRIKIFKLIPREQQDD